jgi:hypothetical protein
MEAIEVQWMAACVADLVKAERAAERLEAQVRALAAAGALPACVVALVQRVVDEIGGACIRIGV